MPRETPHHTPTLCFPSLLAFCVTGLVAVTAATAQVAHGDTSALDDSGSYRGEVQACREGRTAEDRATCLKEARNAAADKRRGVLTNQGDFQANALARCDAHRVKIDQDACRERMAGGGDLTGSVAGGGLLRELEVTLPQEQPPRQAQEGPGDAGAMGAGPSEVPPQDPIEQQEQQEPPPSDDVPGSGMQ